MFFNNYRTIFFQFLIASYQLKHNSSLDMHFSFLIFFVSFNGFAAQCPSCIDLSDHFLIFSFLAAAFKEIIGSLMLLSSIAIFYTDFLSSLPIAASYTHFLLLSDVFSITFQPHCVFYRFRQLNRPWKFRLENQLMFGIFSNAISSLDFILSESLTMNGTFLVAVC